MKKVIMIIGLLLLVSCSTQQEVNYDGASLKIAVIGDIPELNNEKITFEAITLDEFSEKNMESTSTWNAVMITPSIFEKASDDFYIEMYNNSNLPIIFFDSPKRHLPFVNEDVTYQTAHWKSMDNGSHTTIYHHSYLADSEENKEDAWYFYLKDEKNINKLYQEVFKKIEDLQDQISK
ncbi:amino acid oxidase [Sporosarcina gallistercoris]|uniref:amino acid oxidase n=1 Tax=Sporosarcina gallistercoris TaxID=2762245 RepID=UPI003D27A086